MDQATDECCLMYNNNPIKKNRRKKQVPRRHQMKFFLAMSVISIFIKIYWY